MESLNGPSGVSGFELEEPFTTDAQAYIIKCKLDDTRNKILKRRMIIKKQSKSNPQLNDIVESYDEYYEQFKNNILLQIDALENILKYLKNLEQKEKIGIKGEDEEYEGRSLAGIKKNQKLIVREIQALKKSLLLKGNKGDAKYKGLSKYIDID